MLTQSADIDKKTDDAITAMTELSPLFSEQADCYDKIGVYLNPMKASTDLDFLKSRKAYIADRTKSPSRMSSR